MSSVNIAFHNIREVAWGKFDREQADVTAPRVLELTDASGIKHTIAVFPARSMPISIKRHGRAEDVEGDAA